MLMSAVAPNMCSSNAAFKTKPWEPCPLCSKDGTAHNLRQIGTSLYEALRVGHRKRIWGCVVAECVPSGC